jgi:diguanylate cyclase (GGDEF)-like protein
MGLEPEIAATKAAQEARERRTLLYAGVGISFTICFSVGAFVLADALFPGSWERWLAGAAFLTLLTVPTAGLLVVRAVQQEKQNDIVKQERAAELRRAVERADHESARRMRQGQHQEFETRLLNALEMAESETEVLDVVANAFEITLPNHPVELLLADNSHAHLVQVALGRGDSGAPGCPVESPNECPAARRAQVQRFPDNTALDACPKLRNRASGTCGAVCVPVSIMGRTVGVIHVTGETGWTVDDDDTDDLQTLAKQAGARLGLLRIMAETQLQAETDGLTGLANRRTMENHLHALRRRGERFALAMIDLDDFKQLNDSLGHDTGDRALRFFAHTLRESVRAQDRVCRYGGEEFVAVFPGTTVDDASAVLERVREALRTGHQIAGMPPVTASYGVVEADPDEDLDEVFRRADTMLFEAKRGGRDRVATAPQYQLDPVVPLRG